MRVIIFLLLIGHLTFSLSAQDKQDITHQIESIAFGKERTIHIHLPLRYYENPTDTFMVIYALDAQADWYWNMAKSNVSYLVDNYQVIPAIVVGIVTEDRQNEFIPPARDTTLRRNNKGVAHLLQQHLREEVFPLIEKTYRVNQRRAIVGHSRGGAFIGHTLFSDQNDLFDAYIGISPALGFMNNRILRDADRLLATQKALPKFLYCTHGSVGEMEHFFGAQVAQLDAIIHTYANSQLAWQWKQMDQTTHWTVVIPSWNQGLMEMSRAFGMDQYLLEQFAAKEGVSLASQIEKHLAHQQEQLGWTWTPHARIINRWGNDFDEMGKSQRALETYEWGHQLYPENIRILRNIGYIHKQQGQPKIAAQYYQRALDVVERKQADYDPEAYKEIRTTLQEKIKSLLATDD